MKLVAQSCLFCSCIWRRAALQNAAPAAEDRQGIIEAQKPSYTHTSSNTLHLAYALIYAHKRHLFLPAAPSQVLRCAVIVPKEKNRHIILQLLKCVEIDMFVIFSRRELITPLQFLAILNMLAALQYISHASSTLWCPLAKEGKQKDNRCTQINIFSYGLHDKNHKSDLRIK